MTVETIEYEDAVHSFIESNNPESANDTSGDLEGVVTPEQEKMAREAEKTIGNWLSDKTA